MKYTDEELINYLHKYYQEYGRVPRTRDFKKLKEYPNPQTYDNRFGNFKNALQKAGLFYLREDKKLFYRHKYTREELIDKLKEFIEKNNRIPNYDDTKERNDFPHSNCYINEFGSLNNAIIEAGYEITNTERRSKKNEELIDDLKNLYKELGRTPTSKDLDECKYCSKQSTYKRRFGSLYNAFELANIPFHKRFRFYSDEDIIDYWYYLKDKLDRIPTTADIKNSEENIYDSICWRWNSYSDFLVMLGEFEDYQKVGCNIYFTSAGTKCLSYYEYTITEWLEENDVDFVKEVPYRNVIFDDNTNRRFDWTVFNGEDVYYIEMFGIVNNDYYYKKVEEKIKVCQEQNLNLVALYPEDMKKPLDELLSFCLPVD